jgi:predicted GNAT family N-acyltransferase
VPEPADQIAIARATAEQTRPLRRAVLRPHQRAEELVYPGDDAPETLHLAAWLGDDLVGTASLYREPRPGTDDARAFRLRGMAVAPEERGSGLGAELLHRCLEHARAQGASVVWCNARTRAARFYARHGFEAQGEEFELPVIGPHYVMAYDAQRKPVGSSRGSTGEAGSDGSSGNVS